MSEEKWTRQQAREAVRALKGGGAAGSRAPGDRTVETERLVLAWYPETGLLVIQDRARTGSSLTRTRHISSLRCCSACSSRGDEGGALPRTCTICRHEKRQEIDKALVAGEPYRHLAARYATSTGALQRHREHLPGQLVKAHEAQEVTRADSLLDQVRQLADEAREILRNVKTTMPQTAVQAINAVAKVLELQAKILGEIRSGAQVNVGIGLFASPEWGRVSSAVLGAPLPYPEARAAVAGALANLSNEPGAGSGSGGPMVMPAAALGEHP